jgi:threonine aldolase
VVYLRNPDPNCFLLQPTKDKCQDKENRHTPEHNDIHPCIRCNIIFVFFEKFFQFFHDIQFTSQSTNLCETMVIDLRSDTLTQPTPEMRAAMMNARVGDDVFGEDPAINNLEAKVAALFGMESALFCASGTMCNQIAIRIATRPQDEMICYDYAHVYRYEGGGAAYHSGVTACLLPAERGILDPGDIKSHIKPDDIHFPHTSLVCIENTVNKGGGSCYSLERIREIRELCLQYGLHLHLDGARLFNAIVAKGHSPSEYGPLVDTISLCFSKGLGAPVGSVLIGSKEKIREARRVRKVFGGAMRQAGFLAAAADYALDHHVERLAEDHQNANRIATWLSEISWVKKVLPAETNIVIFEPMGAVDKTLKALAANGIKGLPFGGNYIRFITHLDVTAEMMEVLGGKLQQLKGDLVPD